MAHIDLTRLDDRQTFLHQRVLANLHYLQRYLHAYSQDLSRLDLEWETIRKAILLGLQADAAWSAVYQLIAEITRYVERRGYWEAWHEVISKAISVARRLDDRAAEVALLVIFARLLQQQSRFPEAVGQFRQVIRIARQMGDRYNEARACTNLGYYYVEARQWHRAEILCCHALKIFTEIENDHGLAHTENHLGILYARQGRWPFAQAHLNRARQIWQAMGDDSGLMQVQINLGLLYNETNQPIKALYYLENALKQAGLVGAEAATGTIYMNMSTSHRLNGDPTQAELYAWQAEEIFHRFRDNVGLALIEINLGAAYLGQQRLAEAEAHLRTALNRCRALNNHYGQIEALFDLVECSLAAAKKEQAQAWLSEIERLDQPGQVDAGGTIKPRLAKYRGFLERAD